MTSKYFLGPTDSKASSVKWVPIYDVEPFKYPNSFPAYPNSHLVTCHLSTLVTQWDQIPND